jgi:hypothetical protein
VVSSYYSQEQFWEMLPEICIYIEASIFHNNQAGINDIGCGVVIIQAYGIGSRR